MRYLLTTTAIILSIPALVACQTGDPGPMGRGYTSYNQLYKSAPGAPARDVGYDYTNEDNRAVLSQMRYVAHDLIERLDNELSFDVDEIYLSAPAHTAFYNSLDHLIRDELTARGYILSDTPAEAVYVEIFAKDDVSQCQGDKLYVGLAMDVVDKSPATIIADFYDVPQYDYKPAGHLKIPAMNCDAKE